MMPAASGPGKAANRNFTLSRFNINGAEVHNPAGFEVNLRMLNKAARRHQIIPHSNTIDISFIALDILSAIGCSAIHDPSINTAEYSLTVDQTDIETINNSNKMDTKLFANLKGEKILINDIFKNTQDSIFKLDEDLPIRTSNSNLVYTELRNISDYTLIVNKIINLCFLPGGLPQLRALRSI